jgi:hypothetical protein
MNATKDDVDVSTTVMCFLTEGLILVVTIPQQSESK